ncbi:hypothetical protein FHG87_017196, partial [Trinorchestia longiramus]
MLDDMHKMMDGNSAGIDREFYGKIQQCFQTFDDLGAWQNEAWQGMIDFWELRNTPEGETWGVFKAFLEKNATVTPILGMEIQQPCNYASNMVFYHVFNELCDRKQNGKSFNLPTKYVNLLAKAVASIAFSSSFYHGTDTVLGDQQDIAGIVMFVYSIHQALVEKLPTTSSVVRQLSSTQRPLSSAELMESHIEMHQSTPVQKWNSHTEALDLPPMRLVFAGVIATLLTAISETVVDMALPSLLGAFNVTETDTQFLNEKFIPEIKNAFSGVRLTSKQRSQVARITLAFLLKQLYAFFWQETFFINPLTPHPLVNSIGPKQLSKVNKVANYINGFEYFNQNLQAGRDVYPGEGSCNKRIPHAKWHIESALGLLDLVYVTDEVYGML